MPGPSNTSNTGRDILSPLPMFKQKDEYKDQDKDKDNEKDSDKDNNRQDMLSPLPKLFKK